MAFCHYVEHCVCDHQQTSSSLAALDSLRVISINLPAECVVECDVECVVAIETTISLHLDRRHWKLNMKFEWKRVKYELNTDFALTHLSLDGTNCSLYLDHPYVELWP